jgi:hypothetical protein
MNILQTFSSVKPRPIRILPSRLFLPYDPSNIIDDKLLILIIPGAKMGRIRHFDTRPSFQLFILTIAAPAPLFRHRRQRQNIRVAGPRRRMPVAMPRAHEAREDKRDQGPNRGDRGGGDGGPELGNGPAGDVDDAPGGIGGAVEVEEEREAHDACDECAKRGK